MNVLGPAYTLESCCFLACLASLHSIRCALQNGWTTLHLATINNQFRLIDKLLQKGANVNAKDDSVLHLSSHGISLPGLPPTTTLAIDSAGAPIAATAHHSALAGQSSPRSANTRARPARRGMLRYTMRRDTISRLWSSASWKRAPMSMSRARCKHAAKVPILFCRLRMCPAFARIARATTTPDPRPCFHTYTQQLLLYPATRPTSGALLPPTPLKLLMHLLSPLRPRCPISISPAALPPRCPDTSNATPTTSAHFCIHAHLLLPLSSSWRPSLPLQSCRTPFSSALPLCVPQDGFTAIDCAAAYGNLNFIDRLLAISADINAKDNQVPPPPHLASPHPVEHAAATACRAQTLLQPPACVPPPLLTPRNPFTKRRTPAPRICCRRPALPAVQP